MDSVALHHVWQYTDVDRAFWAEHIEGWLPRKIVDAHTHVVNPAFRIEPLTEERRRQLWVAEVDEPMDAATAERCDGIVFPGRDVTHVAIGSVDLDFDIDANNEYVRKECVERQWHGLISVRPQYTAERVDEQLAKPGVIGVKPYYTLIGHDRATRDKHIEAGIFDILPHHILEVLDDRTAWVTLHVPKAGRLAHPDNIREVREIRRRYPNVLLVLAHLGRCYSESHAREGLPPLAEDPGIYFDNSAVYNPVAHRMAIELFGPERILYGTDNPVFYMRGRRQWEGRTYVNRTDHDFYFNKERESPEIEATYTLYMYEALRTIRTVCEELGVTREGIDAMFHDNADRLIRTALAAKAARAQGRT